jgi:hypothetical protein
MTDNYKVLRKLNEAYNAFSNEVVTVTSSVSSLNVPEGAKYALIYVESSTTSGYAVRYWEDGTSPTTTTGIPRPGNTAFDITGTQNLKKIRFIQAQAGTHKLQIQYYK